MNKESVGKRLVQMASGEQVERDALNIAIKIREYDSNLRLKYITDPNVSEAPYALFELCKDGHERMVFEIWELDDRVVDRIRLADNDSNDILARIDAQNGKIKAENKRRYEDKIAEKHDIFKHAFAASGQTYSFVSDDGESIKIITEDVKGGIKVEPRRNKSTCPNYSG